MIQTNVEWIIKANVEAILNPITEKGDFILKSMSEAYPRCLQGMQNIAAYTSMTLSNVYNYYEYTSDTKPSYLINICCVKNNGKVNVHALEKLLYIVTTKFKEGKYSFDTLAIPNPICWGQSTLKQDIIKELLDAYFQSLENIKTSFYYA